MKLGLTITDPCHEVSVHPTLCAAILVVKCRFIISVIDHQIDLYGFDSLPFVFIRIKYCQVFVV